MKNPHTTASRNDSGFMMVALLVCMSIAAIWMAATFTNIRHQAQREKEDDLIFRGEQYARAIVLYQNKNRNLPPPDIDTLLSQHYLRKKWLDPITGKDFVLVGPGIISQTQIGATTPGSTTPPPAASQVNTGGSQQPGITGVRSASTATSIKIYNNQQQYSLWQFDAATYRVAHGMQSAQQAGGGQNGRQGQGTGRDTGPGGAPGRGGPGGIGPGRGGDGRTGGAPPPPGQAGGGRGRGGD